MKNENEHWDTCPIEILLFIFKHLDVKTLAKCILVNRSWRELAIYTLERYHLWQELVERTVFNKGLSIRRKSKLDWRDVYFNSRRWEDVSKMSLKIQHIHQIEYVINLHVYKDVVIVISSTGVTYLEISTFKVIRFISIAVLDFEETNALIVKLTSEGEWRKLSLYGKSNPDDFDLNIKPLDLQPFVYKIEDDRCYWIDYCNVLWVYQWEHRRWNFRSIARYYGPSNLYTLNVYHPHESGSNYAQLYVLLQSGEVLLTDSRIGSYFTKIFCMEVPTRVVKFKPIMFGISSCVVKVPDGGKFEIVRQDLGNQLLIACPGLSCATHHGDVLFLGYNTGKVEVYIISKLLETCDVPERCIDVKQLDEHLSETIVTAIEVHESQGSHHLLIGCHFRIYHLKLTLSHSSND